MQMKTSSSAVSSPPKNPNRRWHISLGWLRLPRKHTHSGSTNSFSPLWSLLSLSPLKSWRRRRDSTSSSPTVSEPSTLPTSPSNFSSRSSPVRSHTVRLFSFLFEWGGSNLIGFASRHQAIKGGCGFQRRYLTDKQVLWMTFRYHRRCKAQPILLLRTHYIWTSTPQTMF